MSRTTSRPTGQPQPSRIPPLQNGDRLSRAEFERRFDATPGLKKAELIEGIVYMPPPVSLTGHGEPHVDLVGLIFVYRASTPGVRASDNGSVRLDLDNMPQPDAMLMIDPKRGGQARVDDGYVVGAPEWVGEVSASTVSFDLHAKLEVYRRNGVREYVVWRTLDGAIDYFILHEGEFRPLPRDADGMLRSRAFPGLWLNDKALLAGDLPAVMNTIQSGIVSPEHAEFVKRLAAS